VVSLPPAGCCQLDDGPAEDDDGRVIKRLTLLLVALGLTACASTRPVAPPVDDLLHDSAFAAPAEPPSQSDIFAISPAMRRYLADTVEPTWRRIGSPRGLLVALYTKQQLQLEYDAERTRTASEAFEARAGNCLSLAIMTGAFAKELGLTVRYQSVDVASTWERSGDLVMHNGHVNVSLKQPSAAAHLAYGDNWTTIDFVPMPEVSRAPITVIDEKRVIAMYMNNRAAESLAQDGTDAAYAWARAAIRQDAGYADAYNTLAVVYRRRGQDDWAEAALRRTLLLDTENLNALGNLAALLRGAGREAEARPYAALLDKLQPHPPFQNYERGMQALRSGNYPLARDLLEKELEGTNGYHEVHLGLAIAYLNLGNPASAARHLEQARENSTTRQQQALYAAKLAHLKALVH